jgi:hypothetical protein
MAPLATADSISSCIVAKISRKTINFSNALRVQASTDLINEVQVAFHAAKVQL